MPSVDLPETETAAEIETGAAPMVGSVTVGSISSATPKVVVKGTTLVEVVTECTASGKVIFILSEVGEEGCDDDCCTLADANTTSPSVDGAIVVVVVVAMGNTDVVLVEEEEALSLVVAVIVVEGGSTDGPTDGFRSRGVLILTSAGSCTVVMVGVRVALLSLPVADVVAGGCTVVTDSVELYFLVLLRMFFICLTNSSSCWLARWPAVTCEKGKVKLSQHLLTGNYIAHT